MSQQRKRTAVFISGRGSNMAALVKAAQAPDFPAEISLVLSNKADAAGLEFAREHGIETLVLSHRDYADRIAFDAALDAHLRIAGIEIVCLAGFMRLLTPWLVERWRDRMINVHPSLLPSFKGLDTHARAIETGVRLHGCTVHFVRAEMDEGPIILQAAVPVHADDTPDVLAHRVLEQEHVIYPKGLALLASGRLRVENERTIVSDERPVRDVLVVPRV
ncbi:phosphoribosylglycinamide formyltransferase [Azorhizobium caulinodans ORS 571]|uniref:Phosphoribosylglycinamide formyltransferase n=1 Tax=Azorhizobium caulinodans (strain ATCC 43989 / DSM 5975 / JCM 20966 / LMG 6465 / NBRC 14845 / NCIMB 13405 / ORS 571) TaxID=438753 RepID=A8HSA6_AZOC5|nr:phosphoribosylglycinamide formyltransferase [Azorhizobium caulinodans]BAF90158.1 phosphoribosylglycinamide formyltransferase [Azorhizobium caulinodans ORS 571]